MTSDFIIDVNEADFEYEVISYSQNTPVVVDFWATWCRPCKTLSPLLERLAAEGHGSFRLARVDVDANPNLALRFGVRSLPTVKAFSQGEVVGEFVGLQPPERVRDFIQNLMPPSPLSLAIEKAEGLLDLHHWMQAEQVLREVLAQNENNPSALLGLAKALLGQGKSHEALAILEDFPTSRQYAAAQTLLPFARAHVALLSGALTDQTELDAAFQNGVRLAGRGNLPAALDGLLDILRQDRHHGGEQTRLTVLALLELMGEQDALTRQYRTELASVLF